MPAISEPPASPPDFELLTAFIPELGSSTIGSGSEFADRLS